MDKCPHCGEYTITAWHKFCAGSACPVKCRKCDGLSYIHGAWSSLFILLLHSSPLVCLLAGLIWWSWWPVIAIPVPLVLVFYASNKWATLKPISPEKARRNSRIATILLILLFAIGITAGLIDHFAN